MSSNVVELSGALDELDLDAIRPASRMLKVHGHAYPVPPALTIPMMAELLELEQNIREASNDPEPPGPDATDAELAAYEEAVSENRRLAVSAINGAHLAVEELVQVNSPGARLSLDVNEIMLVIRWLVRNPAGATGAVVSAIEDAGGEAAELEEGEPEQATPPGAPEGSAPLASARPSSRRSSGGATRPGSRRAGGANASGKTSSSASASPAGA